MSKQIVNLQDNTPNSLPNDIGHTALLKGYSYHSLGELLRNNDELILCSDEIDELQKLPLWHIRDNHVLTNNLMGFIGLKDNDNYCTVHISSRFTKNDKDYFLHYMLQKVFLGQTINLDIGTSDDENLWEFYYYLFPYYLNKALTQGSYKEYVHKQYNDINIKGVIDIKRHLRQNIPFQGKIAYNTREHSYNNRITQLIRHTIEYISRGTFGKSILNSTIEIRESVSQIEYLTPNFYHSNQQTIIQQCVERISNPYWEYYEILRKLCLKILKQDKLSLEGISDRVHGILFDGAWLWEEYLATLLTPEGLIHPDNRTRTKAIKLATNGLYRYPDFYCEQRKIVLDAKYKRFKEDRREDIHQMLAYMYSLKSEKGILVYPSEKLESKTYDLLGHGGELKHQTFLIPKNCEKYQEFSNYQQFCDKMKDNEQTFVKNITPK